MAQENVAVLLMNMGGPAGIKDIQPFLYNLFSDRDIIQFPIPFLQRVFAWLISTLRSPKVAKHYEEIGGGSPILGLTQKQADALRQSLNRTINADVFIGMRYTEPFMAETMELMSQKEYNKVVLLPLYPQFSTTTTMSSYNEFDRILLKKNLNWNPIKIMDWHDNSDYIDVLAHLVSEKLKGFSKPNSVHICFSAHSLPMSVIERGDPYAMQINATAQKVMEKLSIDNPYHVCFQSKVGPIKWLEPTTEKTISLIAQQKDQDILMVPISFVSDHFETNYEIDILYSNMAKELGIRSFVRTDSLNDHPLFIKALTNIVLDNLNLGRSL